MPLQPITGGGFVELDVGYREQQPGRPRVKTNWLAVKWKEMPTIVVETEIHASPQRCFDAARDIGLHCRTVAHTRERAVAGVTSGLIGPGEWVTFEGVHFGVRQRFTARITAFKQGEYFTDEMLRGAFQSMRHHHEFIPHGQSTLMRDTVEWESPPGILGKIADTLILQKYLQKFVAERGQQLKSAIESG